MAAGGGGGMSSVFSLLHENLQKALTARQWNPTPIQESAIPEILDGKNRLLIAPTGWKNSISDFTNIASLYS